MEDTYQRIIKQNEYIINHKDKLTKEVGNNIRRIRTEKSITIAKMAEKAAMSSSYYNQIESGTYGPTLSKILTICNALEISPNDLLKDYLIQDNNKEKLYNEIQKGKNLKINIINYLKNK